MFANLKKVLCLALLLAGLAGASRAQLANPVTNAGTTGTTLNALAKLNTSNQAVIATTSDTTVPVYIVVGGNGTAGVAQLGALGQFSCTMDATNASFASQPVYVINSTTTGGDCHAQTAAPAVGTWVVGFLVSPSTTSGSTALVQVSGGYEMPSSNASTTVNNQSCALGSSCTAPSTIVVANAGTTGTTANTLTKITGAPSTAVITATTDTVGAIGVTVAGAGTTGSATVQIHGQVNCVFDGATTAGDYVQYSSTTAGNCHDAGATRPTSGSDIVGRVLTTNAAGGTFAIDLYGPGFSSTSGGSYTPGAATLDSTSIGQPAGNGNWTYPASTGMTLSGTAPASVSTNGTAATSPFILNGVTGGATTGSATTAGAGSSPARTAGSGGSASGGTNAIGGAGGNITDTAGNGGASGGTAANSNGGSIFEVLGSPGTGGSGAAGSYGQYYILVPNANVISPLNVCLDNGTHNGCNGTPYLQMTANHGLTILQNIKANLTGSSTELANGYIDSQGEVAGPGATGGMVIYDDSTSHDVETAAHNKTNYGIVQRAEGATSQKSETGADATLLSFTPEAVAGSYKLHIVISVSAASTATIGWTATWTDSNGNAQAPTNLSLFQSGAAAPALTFTTSAAGNYYGDANIDINNTATAIVIKLTFSGTSVAAKVTAYIERSI